MSVGLPCGTMPDHIEVTPFVLIDFLLLLKVSNCVYLRCSQSNARLVLRISTVTYCYCRFSRLPAGYYSLAFDISYLMSEGVVI